MGQFLILLIPTLATLIPISSVAVGIALKVYQKEPVVKFDCFILAKIRGFLTKYQMKAPDLQVGKLMCLMRIDDIL